MEEFSRKRLALLEIILNRRSSHTNRKTKKPPGSFQGRIVPTEAKDPVKTFWTKSYEPKKQGVKQFLGNKCL
jgi:hypothetical protein